MSNWKPIGLGLEASAFAIGLHYYRHPNPQRFWFGRIATIYAVVRRVTFVSDHVLSKAVRRFAELGLIGWFFSWLSRFHPDVLQLPAGISGKAVRNGSLHPLVQILALPFNALEQYQYRGVADKLTKMEKPFLDKYNLVWSDRDINVYIGMWPGLAKNRKEAIPENIDLVFDMSNEYSEPQWVMAGREYVCFPTWDQYLPQNREVFIECIDRVASLPRGNIFIHCVFGVSRSVVATICVLLRRGSVRSITEAQKALKAARPAIELRPMHMAFLEEIAPRLMNN